MIRPRIYNIFKLQYLVAKNLPKFLYPLFLKLWFYRTAGKWLNLKAPKTFCEKIQWLKLYDNAPLKTELTDKLSAKKYVAKVLPEVKIAQVYKVFDSLDNLDFSDLPDCFVLKTNHACRTNMFVENKNTLTQEEMSKIKKYFKNVFKLDYTFWAGFELQYAPIKPKLFAEEFLFHQKDMTIIEYEVYCFNGKAEFVRVLPTFVSENGGVFFNAFYYDREGKEVDLKVFFGSSNRTFSPNENTKKIFEYADKLSKDFKFVRVDFLEAKGELYFAEMTFTPYSGVIKFKPEIYDYILGDKLKL